VFFCHFLIYYLCDFYSYIPTPTFPMSSSFTTCFSHSVSSAIWGTNIRKPVAFLATFSYVIYVIFTSTFPPLLFPCPPAVSHTQPAMLIRRTNLFRNPWHFWPLPHILSSYLLLAYSFDFFMYLNIPINASVFLC